MSDDLRQRYEEAFELWTGDTNARRALAEIAEGVHRQWQDEIRDQVGAEGEDVQVWVDRATVWVQTATEQRERAESAERRLAEKDAEIQRLRDEVRQEREFGYRVYRDVDRALTPVLGHDATDELGLGLASDVQVLADRYQALQDEADRIRAELDQVRDHDDTQRFEHLAAADPEDT